MKRCCECEHILPIQYFHIDKGKKDGRASRCKRCAIKIASDWRLNNREKRLIWQRKYRADHLPEERNALRKWRKENPERDRLVQGRARRRLRFKMYGITEEGFQGMIDAQNGLCAVCKTVPNETGFVIDHDHKVGSIRGLLCQRCNRGLGHFRDDLELLESAMDYLQHPPALRAMLTKPTH